MIPATFEQQSMLIVFVGLAGIIAAVSSISNVIKNYALIKASKNPVRTPPMEEEIAKTYATKTELAGFRCEWQSTCRENHKQVEKTFGEVFSVLRKQQTEIIEKLDGVKNWQLGIERQIGKLEGNNRP